MGIVMPSNGGTGVHRARCRDSKTGIIYLKLVNTLGTPQTVHFDIKGAASVAANGESVIMKSTTLDDTNNLAAPTKIVPVTAKESGFAPIAGMDAVAELLSTARAQVPRVAAQWTVVDLSQFDEPAEKSL